jgi:hypothetical protein
MLSLTVTLGSEELLEARAEAASALAAGSDGYQQGKHASEILHTRWKTTPVPTLSELASGSTHRDALNNWLQIHDSVSILSWMAAKTGPPNDATWTASTLSKNHLHQWFAAKATIFVVDGIIYATGIGKSQGSAKEMAAGLTRQRLHLRPYESKAQRIPFLSPYL